MYVMMKLLIDMTIILVFMNVSKTYVNQRINKCAQHWVLSRNYSYSLKTNITTCPKSLHITHRIFRY